MKQDKFRLIFSIIFSIFFFAHILSISYAQTYVTKYLGTTAISNLGGTTYWNLTDTTGTANTATSVKIGKNTGKFYFKPGTGSSTSTGDPDSGTPVGYGWGLNYTLKGSIPAGTWTFQVKTTATATGKGYVGVVVYKRCGGVDTRLFGVFNNTWNVLATTTANITTITTTQPTFDVGGCYLKFEYWLNVTTATSSATATVTFTVNEASEFVQFPIDITPPTWSNQQQSTSIPGVGAKVNLSAYWSDNGLLDKAWLATNETGSWENKTSIYLISLNKVSSGWSNFTWQNTSIKAGTIVAWRIYANDTDGNVNATDIMTFEVKPTYLLVNLTFPSPLTYTETNPYLVSQYSSFLINASVKCYSEGEVGNCGLVLGSPRYNSTSVEPNQPISTTEDAIPFWYKKLERVINGTNYVINGGFETGSTNGWIVVPGLQTPRINSTIAHDGVYSFGAVGSSSTTSTPNALYWRIVANSTSGFSPVTVTEDLYFSMWIYGNDYATYSYTNVTMGFDDGSTVIVASTLGQWYASGGVFLGGNPGYTLGASVKILSRIADYKPVGSKIVSITIEVRKGQDTYSRYYPTVLIDSIQLFEGTIPLQNYTDSLFFRFPRNYSSGYLNATNFVDYASLYRGASVTVSSQLTSSTDYYDFYLPKYAIDDLVFNESYGIDSNSPKYWKSNNEGAGAWINVSFPQAITTNKIALWDPQDSNNITSGHLEFEDGSVVSFGALPPDGSRPLIINFPEKTTRWVRVVMDSVQGVAGLAEIDVYSSQPSNQIYVHTYTFPEVNQSSYIDKGIDSYFEVYDIEGKILLDNESISDIMGGDIYDVAGIQACGYLSQGDACQLSWLINATGPINSIWTIDVNFSSSFETIPKNDTDDSYIKIVEPPYLEVTLISPDPTTLTYITQNFTFWINASVTCRNIDCGKVNGTVRYNASSPYPDTSINETYGALPFFINETPANAMKSCGDLLKDQTCNLSWLINATGEINSAWKIGVLFNSSLSNVQQNHTSNATIVIIGCVIDYTLQFANIDFGELLPSTQANPATGNNNNLYNITVNEGSCNLDFYIRGSNLTNSTYSSLIEIGNLTFSNITNDYSTSYNLTSSWQLIKSNVPPLTNVTTWYWLNVPSVYAGYYSGTIEIKGVPVGWPP